MKRTTKAPAASSLRGLRAEQGRGTMPVAVPALLQDAWSSPAGEPAGDDQRRLGLAVTSGEIGCR